MVSSFKNVTFCDKKKDNDTNIARRPNPVLNANSEYDMLRYGMKTVPGNGSYARITSKGKRINIYGDSTIKRLKDKEIARHIKERIQTFIRSFPGSTTAYLDHTDITSRTA